MSAPCALCEREDWLDVGICAACAGDDRGELVFLAPMTSTTNQHATERTLRELIGAPLERRYTSEVVRGRQPLVLLPSALARRAVHTLDDAGMRARLVPRAAAYRALPLSFAIMVFAILMVGSIGALRGLPLLLSASAFMAALLLMLAFRALRTPLVSVGTSSALLPVAARRALVDTLAELDDADARALLIDIARTGEATFAALPDAFRAAGLGTAVVELLCEAGPLAREAAHLRAIAQELDAREARHAEETRQVADAATARFALLEDVLALLSRLARDGARSDEEVVRLLQQVRAEAARRVEAENVVSALLQEAPAGG